ncbi:MAG: hypothetical protein EAZ08_06745 [Cytophagales bacterium]|nr:MAG: hypothetical protein EAZ08_06745 [Cytophagales bacterium]
MKFIKKMGIYVLFSYKYHKQLILLISCICWLCIYVEAKAQKASQIKNFQINDSAEIVRSNQLVQQYYFKNEYDKAIEQANKAFIMADGANYEREKAKSLMYMGKAFRQKENYFESLKNLLKALRIYENLYDNNAMAEAVIEIAFLFQHQKAYVKANEHFNNAYNIYKKINEREKANKILEYTAKIYLLIGDNENAYKSYNTLLELKRSGKESDVFSIDTTQVIHLLNQLIDIELGTGNFKNAEQHSLELVKFYEHPSKIASLSTLYNNLGFISKRLNSIQQSFDYFNKSLALYEKNKKNLTDSSYVLFLENMGVAYANLKLYPKADEFFNKALKINQQLGNKAAIAKSYNYLATNYYINGDESKALEAVSTAISNANTVNAEEILLTSYRILEAIYIKDNSSKAKEYATQAERIRANIIERQQIAAQKVLEGNSYLETLEEELKQQIVSDEQNGLRFRKLSDESERQARENEKKRDSINLQVKEIAILRGEQQIREIALNNERLESEKAQQMLNLLRQKGNYEQQRLKLEIQVRAKEAQEEIQKQVIEEQKRKINDANLIQQRGITIIILGALVFLIVVVSLYITYRNNRSLKSKNVKIAEQSESIASQNQELEAQRNAIVEKNRILDLQNTKINESIRAAQTIQQAILPKHDILASTFADFFILYLPKDVVSGDFYWIEKIDNKVIIAVVDCTGHGVSGAFMSMIGSSLLDKITEKSHIIEPDMILNMLDQELKEMLGQDKHLSNEVGMDMAVCVISQDNENTEFFQLTFAGAGNSMYYIIPQIGKLEEAKGDSKSIGITSRKKLDFKYAKKELFLHRGSSIYFCSDGFLDQNNANKEKIGTLTLKKLLFENAGLPMEDQKQEFSTFLKDFQKDEPQRDDITIIGLRL